MLSFLDYTPNLISALTRVTMPMARQNLARVALTRSLDPEAMPPEIKDYFNTDQQNPWRDPFTEESFKLVEDEDGGTTIYSLGPDQEDQGGRIAYDPTNGTLSPGDIVIRIP
jgi:hypothetical protein